MQKTHSAAFLKRRKFLMVLPILVLPFITMAFATLGGGTGKTSVDPEKKGLNLILPDADFKKEIPQDKMSLYNQAARDSAKFGRQQHIDRDNAGFSFTGSGAGFQPDPNETAIQLKLAQINAEIAKEPASVYKSAAVPLDNKAELNADVNRLENLMKQMQQQQGADPEMDQLNSMMEKIIQIQNPELIKQKMQSAIINAPDSLFRAIPAQVITTRKVSHGSVIELCLLDTLYLLNQVIPKGHSVFGIAAFSNQRLNLEIKNIRLGTSIIPVSLTVFDKRDGMIGIDAPEAIITDALNDGADDAVRNLQLMSMDQSITTQVAGAGLQAAKGLFSKKVKRIKIKLEAGRQVLLRNNKPVKSNHY